jgi:hypothetical protein
MGLKAFDEVVLTSDLSNGSFKEGTIGVVVEVFPGSSGYALEFFAANGQTLGFEIVSANEVAPVSEFPFPVRVERAAKTWLRSGQRRPPEATMQSVRNARLHGS